MSFCTQYPDGLTITRSGATKEIVRKSDGVRWCFKCRKHREFAYVVTADVAPSYYGPEPSIKCGHCGLVDGDLFPGREREWA